MTRHLDLSTEANWQLMYSVSIPATVVATIGTKTYYAEITPIRPSVVLDKPVLGISVNTSIPAGKQWRYGGSFSRYTTSVLGEIYFDERQPLFLGRFNLLVSDNLSNDYQAQIIVPKWFPSVNVAIYQYEGDDRTAIQKELDLIKAAVIPG